MQLLSQTVFKSDLGVPFPNTPSLYNCQPRTQDLSLGKTLAAAGHVPHQKFSARGGVAKVSNYINMLTVGYSLKHSG